MKLDTPLAYIDKALEVINERCDRHPDFALYTSVLKQLEYIKAVFNGTESDKSRLHELTIGAMASKEFEGTDDELAEVLVDAYYIAIQSARGLKIILPD